MRVFLQPVRAFALLTSVGLLTLWCRRNHRFHTVDGIAKLLECDRVSTQVCNDFSTLANATTPVRVMNYDREGEASHARHHPEKGHFVESQNRSISGSLQFDLRQIGQGAHQFSSVNKRRATDVVRPDNSVSYAAAAPQEAA